MTSRTSITVAKRPGWLLAFVVAVCATSWLVVSVHFINEAERNLLAFTAAAFAVTEFVEREHRWPSTLDELRGVPRFASSEHDILERVQIAFDVPLDAVTKCTPENFPYIVGSKPTFPRSAENKVRILLAVASRVQSGAASDSFAPGCRQQFIDQCTLINTFARQSSMLLNGDGLNVPAGDTHIVY